MTVLVSDDVHVFRLLSDGSLWTDAINDYSFYKRYLDVFDKVILVGRMKDVEVLPQKHLRLDGPGLDVFGIPFFQGPKEFASKFLKIKASLKGLSDRADVAILRMPSVTSFMTARSLDSNLPLGLEMVYDPYNDIHDKNSSLKNKILWRMMASEMKHYARIANGVSYVTKEAIQRHIPSSAKIHGTDESHFETYYSSIALSDDAFVTTHRVYEKSKKCKLALSDVAMNNDRKGESILIRVVAEARKRGYDVSATLVGDGSLRQKYETMCQELNIQEYVFFTGLLPSSDYVREIIKDADLFLFPTKAEGLPRGVLEAMALGLPVLSTPVGGIPEIIDKEYLFDPLDIEGFTNKLCDLLDNPEEMTKMSNKNLSVANQYRNEILQSRRNEFYSKLRNLVLVR